MIIDGFPPNTGTDKTELDSSGTTVFLAHASSTGANYALGGRTDSFVGTGVFGVAAASSGLNVGVVGETDSIDGIGVGGSALSVSTFVWTR